MKKALLILLILSAVCLYSWDGFLVFRILAGKSSPAAATPPVQVAALMPMHLMRVAHFVEQGKSPFLPYKEMPKPRIAASVPAGPAATKAAEPLPAISLNGIMWSETNPVAIINLPDGSSTVAKPGQMLLGTILVKKINKGQVTVVFGKREYVLK